jgi:hypothetical protein
MIIDFFKCFELIASEMDQTHISLEAEISYNVQADALVWSDEYPASSKGHLSEYDCVKILLRYRTSLILGSPDQALKPYWERAMTLFPNWAGFCTDRLNSTDEAKKYFDYHHKRDTRKVLSFITKARQVSKRCPTENDKTK